MLRQLQNYHHFVPNLLFVDTCLVHRMKQKLSFHLVTTFLQMKILFSICKKKTDTGQTGQK